MPSQRQCAVEIAGSRTKIHNDIPFKSPKDIFGRLVFHRGVMEKRLPKEIYKNLIAAMAGKEKVKLEYADKIAEALKRWAVEHGATHYSHWFHPLTGSSAEKHDSFIAWDSSNLGEKVIEKLSGKMLIQGEPDASSFPSGGLRSTYEARGYTGWDPSSPPFLWLGGDGVTLCIPCIFFSWTGEVLDTKIPLLRSDAKINEAVLRLLKLTGIPTDHVFSTIGLEQEYFVIDRALRNLRPDLLILGKTVLGASAPKGQELQDHYFGSVKDRILSFMREFEERALELGIPVKTRHNEVAPSQHEIAPVFEKATLAVDHNIILMELMRQVATRRDLAVLLHEKPFAHINGSGKHSNWSLMTNNGLNLLDPTDTPENNLHFLILLVAILSAIHKHNALVRASVGSASNDDRLGGHEAPPAIISAYLGQELEELLDNIESKGSHVSPKSKKKYDFGLSIIPDLPKDQTDRNRTSPFAFTGNKFEFRAVGSSQNPAFAITVINAIVAESLNEILDEIEKKSKNIKAKLVKTTMDVLQHHIKKCKGVRFSGDNYTHAWEVEAKKRGLANHKNSLESFSAMVDPKTIKAFKGILTEEELKSRYEIVVEQYIANIEIEAKLIIEFFRTKILPPAVKTINDQQNVIENSPLKEFTKEAIKEVDHLEEVLKTRNSTKIKAHCQKARHFIDLMEGYVNDDDWQLPKYRELLWLV